MPIRAGRAVKIAAASVFAAAALLSAPVAFAEGSGGVPDPGPAVPVPAEPAAGGAQGECQSDESVDPANGNCVPTMTPVAAGQGPAPELPVTTAGDTTSTTSTGIGADLVPNINGDPCSGYWESTVCLTENAPAVRPQSTLSSSP